MKTETWESQTEVFSTASWLGAFQCQIPYFCKEDYFHNPCVIQKCLWLFQLSGHKKIHSSLRNHEGTFKGRCTFYGFFFWQIIRDLLHLSRIPLFCECKISVTMEASSLRCMVVASLTLRSQQLVLNKGNKKTKLACSLHQMTMECGIIGWHWILEISEDQVFLKQ